MLDVEGSKKARDSVLRDGSGLTTCGIGAVDGPSIGLEALLAKDVETTKYLGVGVGLFAIRTL